MCGGARADLMIALTPSLNDRQPCSWVYRETCSCMVGDKLMVARIARPVGVSIIRLIQKDVKISYDTQRLSCVCSTIMRVICALSSEKMAKSKKKVRPAELTADIPWIPAVDVFAEPGKKPYEWAGWGLVIRHLRDFTGMDQSVFGRMLRGYTRTQISRYETEATEPPVSFWITVMRMFGVNLNWVLAGEGPPCTSEFAESEERQRLLSWTRMMTERDDFLTDLCGDGSPS